MVVGRAGVKRTIAKNKLATIQYSAVLRVQTGTGEGGGGGGGMSLLQTMFAYSVQNASANQSDVT